MKTNRIGLCALTHPFGMLSLTLLLVNDHLLKHLWPSPLTGKLSDFAGLFFFPFLLAAVLGWLPGLRKQSVRGIGIFCFGLTFVWFLGVKTVPAVNTITSGLLRSLTGRQSQIMLDPGDLWALVMLLPGWMMWKDLERQPAHAQKRSLRALPILLIAAFATLATTWIPHMDIKSLAVSGNVIYAGAWPYSSSQDAGSTWVELNREDIPESALTSLDRQPIFPLTVCDPDDASRCYRTNKDEKIEISSNGGATWQTGWQIPAGRRLFIERDHNGFRPAIFEIGPYDLAFVDSQPTNVLVAAMGSKGILTHTPQDGWKDITFPNFIGVRLKAENFIDSLGVIYPEIIIICIMALIAIPLLHHWWNFRKIKHADPLDEEYETPTSHKGMWIFAILLAIGLLMGRQIMLFGLIYLLFGLGIALALAAVSALLNAVLACREERLSERHKSERDLVIWLTAEGLLLIGIPPYIWWAMADIQTYGTATAIALSAILLLAGLSLFLLDRLARKAVIEAPPSAAKPTDNNSG